VNCNCLNWFHAIFVILSVYGVVFDSFQVNGRLKYVQNRQIHVTSVKKQLTKLKSPPNLFVMHWLRSPYNISIYWQFNLVSEGNLMVETFGKSAKKAYVYTRCSVICSEWDMRTCIWCVPPDRRRAKPNTNANSLRC